MAGREQVAFITGGSRGIGFAVAEGLAREGWKLWIAGRDPRRLEDAAGRLKKSGCPELLAVPLDVSDPDAVRNAVDGAWKRLGRIDLLFNNAAINHQGTWDLSAAQMQEILDVNIGGAWNMISALVPRFREQRFGHIINMASIAGNIGFPGSGAYCSTKFAVRGLSESLFRELVPLGIKVTALSPSWVATDMAHYSTLAAEEMIQPEDMFTSVKYLMSLSPQACVKELIVECKGDLS